MVQELEKIRLEWAKRDTYLRHFDLTPFKMTEWFSARPPFQLFPPCSAQSAVREQDSDQGLATDRPAAELVLGGHSQDEECDGA